MSVVVASQTVPLVLPDLTGRGEQAHVAPDEEVVLEIGLKGFGGYLSSVHVHRVEAYGVVLGVKRILDVRTVVGIVIDAAQHQTFRQSAEEQVLVRVQPSTRGNGVQLAVDGPHRILDRALLESLDGCHLHGGIEGGLLDKQGGIDDFDPVIGVGSTSHERKRSLIAHQSDLDIDTVDQEFILQKQVHVSHDCLCTNAIVVVEYVGLTFLGRLSRAPSLRCSDSCLRGCSFYTFTRSHARDLKVTQHAPTRVRDALLGCRFYVLTR